MSDDTTEIHDEIVARLDAEHTILCAIATCHLDRTEQVMALLRAEGVLIALDIVRDIVARATEATP